jgi:membrane-associated phospholipid phosphatase
MGINISYFLQRIIIAFAFIFIIPITSASEKRDTLVYKNKRDTSVLVKAQVVDIDSSTSLIFYKTRPFGFVGYVPRNLVDFCKVTTRKNNLTKVGLLIGGTAVLIALDQKITDASQQFGRYIHLNPDKNFAHAISIKMGGFHLPVLDVPRNLNSSFYFLGEGWPSILIASGFYSYGSFAKDYRALQTSSEMAEMFITLGITVQFIKRITGRESPDGATAPGGVWRPFPNPSKYQKQVSHFDAFPSGHLATAMATVTIISGNYPNNPYIKPIGYTLMGVLGYSMLNNGVHWASDYPIAIAIGYVYGKIALTHGQQVIHKRHGNSLVKTSFTPMVIGQNAFGMSYRVSF